MARVPEKSFFRDSHGAFCICCQRWVGGKQVRIQSEPCREVLEFPLPTHCHEGVCLTRVLLTVALQLSGSISCCFLPNCWSQGEKLCRSRWSLGRKEPTRCCETPRCTKEQEEKKSCVDRKTTKAQVCDSPHSTIKSLLSEPGPKFIARSPYTTCPTSLWSLFEDLVVFRFVKN